MRARYVIAVLALATGACSPYDYTYKAWVIDPGAVARADQGTITTPVPSRASDEVIARGELPTGTATSTTYAVHAERDTRGSLSLSVETRAALAYGERVTLVDAGGLLTYPTFADAHFTPDGPDVHMPYCASLSSGRRGYTFGAGPTCIGSPLARGDLVTPRSNVFRIVEQRRTQAWGAAIGGGLLYGAVVVPIALPMSLGAFDSNTATTAGELMLGIGGAGVLALVILAIATSDDDRVVYQTR